jgi:diamine N-acetyltransferase
MTNSITTRPAKLAEAPSLETLFEALDEHHRLALPHIFHTPTAARREQSWLEKRVAGPDSAILVAEGVDGQIIGLVVLVTRAIEASTVRDARRIVEIDELVVAAEARHLGVGSRLIQAAKNWAQARDISDLEVCAWSFNLEAIGFYKRVGFQPTVTRFAMTAK